MVRAIQGFAMAGLKDLIDTLFERVSFTIPRPLDKICKYLTSGGFIHLAMDLIPDNEEGEEILKYIMNETACLRSEENIEMIFAHPYLAGKQSETIIYMIKACATELWVDMANNLLGRYKLSHTNQQYLNACRVVASIYASIGLIKPFIDIYKSIGYAEMDASGYIRNGWIDQYIQVTLICKRNELHNLQSNQLQAKLSSLKLNSSKTVDVGLYLLTATVSATTAAFFIDRPESFRRVLAHINNDFTRLIFASAWGMGQSLDQCAVYNDMLQSRRLTFSMLERNMLDMLPILEKAKLNYGLATYRQAHVLRKKHAREILLMLGRYLQFLSLDIVLLHIVPIITGLNIAEARQLHAAVSLNTYQNATLFCQQSNTSTDNLETHYTTKNGCKHRL